MRTNLPVTQLNNDYPAHLRMVSTTTAKGVINHVNQDFIDVCGFSEEELLGEAHNIVRHPDMPQAAFIALWTNMSQGLPWMGLVKNRCKNGDHYWVDAFVIGSGKETNGKTDLQSVRCKPSTEEIERAISAYERINKGQSAISSLHPKHWPVFTKIVLGFLLGILPFVLYLFLNAGFDSISLAILALSLIMMSGVAQFIARPFQQAADRAKNIYSDELAQYIYTGRLDELGAIELSKRFLSNKMETALWRVTDSAEKVTKSTKASVERSKDTQAQTQNQKVELEQLAAAMNEMSVSINEVAGNTAAVSELMQSVGDRVEEGADQVKLAQESVSSLVLDLEKASRKVKDISEGSQSISSLVESIHGIAEQTNLLALNAAIEAARAGEQGRGFAVVADEVRNLANSTAGTTEQIQNAIRNILADVNEAVTLVDATVVTSGETVEQSGQAGASLELITSITKETLDSVLQTSSATEQQSAVCEEINRNVHRIQEASVSTCNNAEVVQGAQQSLLHEVQILSKMVKDFTRKAG